MKISKIRISNLASIEGDYLIDFEQEPLLSTGIFAISGPTGAGKSTILDAMCLALYDKIPRFERSAGSAKVSDNGKSEITQNDVRNILRRGAADGFAQVEFIATDDLTYRSVWTVRRAYGKADGNLRAQTLQVFNLSSGEELQGTKSEILHQLVGLIGLSYEQFTRTVLLAQNDFATFLRSSENDKAELLEKLTGTDIYSKISVEIFSRFRDAKQAYDEKKSLLNNVKLLSDEELAHLTSEFSNADKALAAHRLLLEEAKKRQTIFAELLKLRSSRVELSAAFEANKVKLSALTVEIENHKTKIERFEVQTKAKETEIEQAVQLDAVIQTRQEALKTISDTHTTHTKELAEANTVLAAKKRDLDAAKAKLRALYKEFEVSSDISVEQILSDLSEQVKANLAQQNQLNGQKNQIGIDQVYLHQVKLRKERQAVNQLKSDYLLFAEKTRQLTQLESALASAQTKTKAGTTNLESLKIKLEGQKQTLLSAKEAYHKAQLQVSKDVQALRASLKEGDPCPVCGSKAHEFTNQAVENLFKIFEDNYRVSELAFEKTNNLFITQNQELKSLASEVMELSKNITTQKEGIEGVKRKHEASKFTQNFISVAEQELETSETTVNKQIQLHTKLQKQVDLLVAQQNKLHKQTTVLTTLVDEIKSRTSILQLAAQKQESIQKSADQQAQELAKQKAVLEVYLSDRAKMLKGKSVKEVRAFIEQEKKNQKAQLDALSKNHLELSQSQSMITGRLDQLKERLVELEKQVEDDSPQASTKQIEELSVKIKTLEDQKSTLDHALKTNAANLIEVKKLRASLEKLFGVMENWAKLNDLFGSSTGAKFKVIAQSYTLKILLLHANKHLSYLARRYQLKQIGDSLSLQIIDCDMLNQERTILSLSGGESFLISLALALGLSSLSSNNLKVESLFIDEGFGSLDMDSLNTAMDALEQLQLQGRKIGVISHVQEMSERIPVQIRLVKEDQGRSRIVIE